MVSAYIVLLISAAVAVAVSAWKFSSSKDHGNWVFWLFVAGGLILAGTAALANVMSNAYGV